MRCNRDSNAWSKRRSRRVRSPTMRHATLRFALEPTPVQELALARHAGASRFAYNQCLRLVTDAMKAQRVNPSVWVPWSGFGLINAFDA